MIIVDLAGAIIGYVSPATGIILFMGEIVAADEDRLRLYLASQKEMFEYHKDKYEHIGSESFCNKCESNKTEIYNTEEKLTPGIHKLRELFKKHPEFNAE